VIEMVSKREWDSREVVVFWAKQAALLAAAIAGIEGGSAAFGATQKATQYQTVAAAEVDRSETRDALDRIETKLDKMTDRIDSLATRVAK
jgi:hypothetical protein